MDEITRRELAKLFGGPAKRVPVRALQQVPVYVAGTEVCVDDAGRQIRYSPLSPLYLLPDQRIIGVTVRNRIIFAVISDGKSPKRLEDACLLAASPATYLALTQAAEGYISLLRQATMATVVPIHSASAVPLGRA